MQVEPTSNNVRIGLIIQGPLVSRGKPGAVAHISQDKINASELVDYDCRKNITQIIRDFGPMFKHIVISTWDDQLQKSDHWKNAAIVTMPDPGGLAEQNPHLYKFNNKFRQFIGIRQGVDALKRSGDVDCVVRIRTDQYLDLKCLVKSFLSQNGHQTDKIYVPLFRPVGTMLADFYFAAELKTLDRFCNAVLADDMYEFVPCVHREMVLKHAYYNYRDTIDVPEWAFFPRWPMHSTCSATKQIISYMFTNAFVVLDPTVFRSLVWRGSVPAAQYFSSRLQRVDLGDVHGLSIFKRIKHRHVVPAWLGIDWENYFAFRTRLSGQGISLPERLLIIISSIVWRVWIGGRKLLGTMRRLV